MVDDTPNPTPAELEILRQLWREPGLTVREVHDRLTGKSTGYTTALKTMQIMLEKRLVKREPIGKAHKYFALIPQAQVQGSLVRDLLDRAFEGASRNLVLRALSERRPSSDELAEIRQMLDQLEDESK